MNFSRFIKKIREFFNIIFILFSTLPIIHENWIKTEGRVCLSLIEKRPKPCYWFKGITWFISTNSKVCLPWVWYMDSTCWKAIFKRPNYGNGIGCNDVPFFFMRCHISFVYIIVGSKQKKKVNKQRVKSWPLSKYTDIAQ